jgi:hypothetical protein
MTAATIPAAAAAIMPTAIMPTAIMPTAIAATVTTAAIPKTGRMALSAREQADLACCGVICLFSRGAVAASVPTHGALTVNA